MFKWNVQVTFPRNVWDISGILSLESNPISSLKSILDFMKLNNITMRYYKHTKLFQCVPKRVVRVQATNSVSLTGEVPANLRDQSCVSCCSLAEGANLVVLISLF